MEVSVENLEKSTAAITVSIPAEEFEKALDRAYQRNKNRFNIPGFRRGHATRAMIEKLYGEGVFYEEAADRIINETYPGAMRESGLSITSRPEIDITEIKKGEPFVYKATVAVKPPVTLGEYKGIKVERADSTVTDEDVDREIERTRESNARIITVDDGDYELKNGDTAVIDFEGFVDGETFAGGKGEDYPLVIGSGSFIDNFEEQLIGAKVGEDRTVHVTFPTPYQERSLEGKPAEFRVKVREIKQKELPELDDEFASEVSEFDTLEEYRASVLKDLKDKKERAAADENEARVIKAVTDAADVELPDAMVEQGIDDRVEEAGEQLKRSGISVDQFLQITGQSMKDFREGFRDDVTERFKVRLVFEEIAAKEGIEPDDDAVEAELGRLASAYSMDIEDVKRIMVGSELEHLKEDLRVREALDMVVAEAVLTGPDGATEESTQSSEMAETGSQDQVGKDEVEF